MRTVVAFPGPGKYAQQVALTFAERGELEAFLTTVAYNPGERLDLLLRSLGSVGNALRQGFMRRAIPDVPRELIRTRPFYEILRTTARRAGANPIVVDQIFDKMARDFDHWVAVDYVSKAQAIYAYEYTAHASFTHARVEKVARILDLPSLDSRAYEALRRGEKARHPELCDGADAYFDRKFPERQARREAEREMADVIVANSTLTKRSHVEAGADPKKFIVVPLGAPPCIDEVRCSAEVDRPLQIIWAGNFSLTKGAHIFLDALRGLGAAAPISTKVFGRIGLPISALKPTVEHLQWMGYLSQHVMFSAFEQADVLVFPTLSDGFGMVVLEAFSRGLPVITTDQAGASDFVRNGVNGFVVAAGDRKALSDSLEWCLDNRAALHQMRYAALETARSWQWPDYRAALADRLCAALQRAGYESGL